MISVVDSSGSRIALGRKLGAGGEGAVYEHAQNHAAVVKIYHHPLSAEKAEKLRLMAAGTSPDLAGVSAWPMDVVRRQDGVICGFIMPRVAGFEPIHHLYHPGQRRQLFPYAEWGFLIAAARNCARAFATFHQRGIVVGDVNQGNIVVARDAIIKLIDCDSFQFRHNGRVFKCVVGVPHFTPPEIQGVPFDHLERTANHDLFGLAIIIFHLLFMGRHPFAGRFAGAGEMPIERAIKEFRFAFSVHASSFLMKPPPHALSLAAVPECLSSLFEKAFAPMGSRTGRPSADDWDKALEQVVLSRCANDASHRYFEQLPRCPWCLLEENGGPAFFISAEAALNFDPQSDAARLWQLVMAVEMPPDASAFQVPAPPAYVVPAPMPPDIERYRHLTHQPLPPLPAFNPEPLPVLQPYEPLVIPPDPVFVPRPLPQLPPQVQQLLHAGQDSFIANRIERDMRRVPFHHRALQVGTFLLEAGTIGLAFVSGPAAVIAGVMTVVFIIGWTVSAVDLRQSRPTLRELAHGAAVAAWHDMLAQAQQVHVARLAAEQENEAERQRCQAEAVRLAREREQAPAREEQRRKEWEAQRQTLQERRDEVERRNEEARLNWIAAFKDAEAQRQSIQERNDLIDSARLCFAAELEARMQKLVALQERMDACRGQWPHLAPAFHARFAERKRDLVRLKRDYDQLVDQYKQQRARLLENQRSAQLRAYLEQFAIDDADIPGIGAGRKATLSSFNIESAADIEDDALSGLAGNGFGPVLCNNLKAWRSSLESGFHFERTRGIGPAEYRQLMMQFRPLRNVIESKMRVALAELKEITREALERRSALETEVASLVVQIAQANADVHAIL